MNHLYTFILSLLVLPFYSTAQSSHCSNIDFEEGNFSEWTIEGDAALVNTDQNDFYGNFSLSLSGNYAVQLGGKIAPVETAPFESRITRTITVTNENKFLIYGFAVVFLGYPHASVNASYVSLSVFDANENILPCASFTAYAQSEVGLGFFQSAKPLEANMGNECCYPVYYKPWERNIVDLSSYIGQTLTFRLSSNWCEFNVDWGYAYVDLYCAGDLLQEYSDCRSGKSRLSTIEGMSSYTWTGPGIVSGQSTSSVEINMPGTYSVFIPNPNGACSDIMMSINADLAENINTLETSMEVQSDSTCVGYPFHFQNTSTTLGYLDNFQWSFGDNTTSSSFSPEHVFTDAGTYNVQLIAEDTYNCSDTADVTIVVQGTLVDLGPDKELCGEASFLLSPVLPEGTDYLWSDGSANNIYQVTESGTITLMVTLQGCTATDSTVITGELGSISTIPNVITPNGDGINDIYLLEVVNAEYFRLQILDRWGKCLFKTDNPAIFWDGKTPEGDSVDDGVYFYDLVYKLACKDEDVKLHGHITVSR